MSISQQFLVCDSSTLTNFKQWAHPISSFFSTATWAQTSDTGQVNWSTISSVPGSAAFVYEIWKPNDGLAGFFVRIEYGNVSGTNCPSLKLTLSTSTDGAGNPTGFVLGPVHVNPTGFTAPSATTQYECNFSGAAGRMGVMMWRNGANSCQQFFAVERSVDSGGNYTGEYVTLWVCGLNNTTAGPYQASLHLAVGPTRLFTQNALPVVLNWVVRFQIMANQSCAFNGTIPFDTCTPFVGKFDWQCTAVGMAAAIDIAEGVPFSATVYGIARTYMPSALGFFQQIPMGWAGGFSGAPWPNALCMRYD